MLKVEKSLSLFHISYIALSITVLILLSGLINYIFSDKILGIGIPLCPPIKKEFYGV